MDIEKLNLIRRDILSCPLPSLRSSHEFCGVYLHSNSVFKLEDHEPPIKSFRIFSEYSYPIYLFVSSDAISPDLEILVKKYDPIKIILIPQLKDIYEFNNFSINNLLYFIDPKYERLFYMQSDGFLIKSGWEAKTYGYSYLGARWKEPIKVIENTFNFPEIYYGNGGCGYRSRKKCLQILDLVHKNGGQQNIVKGLSIDGKVRNVGWFLAEDCFFCWAGFGSGLFESVSVDHIDSFAREPLKLSDYTQKIKPCHAFHRIDE